MIGPAEDQDVIWNDFTKLFHIFIGWLGYLAGVVVIVDGEEAGLSFEYILGKIFIPLVIIKVT